VSEKVVNLVSVYFKVNNNSIVDFSEPLCVDSVIID